MVSNDSDGRNKKLKPFSLKHSEQHAYVCAHTDTYTYTYR